MNRSESIKNLSSALVLAQKEAVNAKKTQKAVYGKYAPLPELIDENKPIFARHGLALLQVPVSKEREVGIHNILIHESGEYLEFDALTLTAEKMTPQGAGAAITYARRYSLSGILNIASEDDDDAQSFEKVREVPTYPTPSKTETVETFQAKPFTEKSGFISEGQQKRIFAIAKGNKAKTSKEDQENVKLILAKYGYPDTKSVKWTDYEKICKDIADIQKPSDEDKQFNAQLTDNSGLPF